jgi:hypothetical protein
VTLSVVSLFSGIGGLDRGLELASETSLRSIGAPLADATLWPLDSPVRTRVTLDVVPASMASRRDYGLRSPAAFATFDPGSSSWRTSLVSLLGDSAEWSATWPLSGMTRSGTAYRRRPSAPRTYERALGFWPTPVASEAKRTTPYKQGGHSLSFVLGGTPNPRWTEWLMGFPAGWLELSTSRTVP